MKELVINKKTVEQIRKERKRHYRIKKIKVFGIMLLLGTGLSVANNRVETSYHDTITYKSQVSNARYEPIILNKDQLAELNLVLVNNGADFKVINEVENTFKEKEIPYQSVSSSNLPIFDGSETIISFIDYGGEKPKVIGQYEEKDNLSDPLCLGLAASLDADTPQCGIKVIDEYGGSTLGPSIIEEEVSNQVPAFATLAIPKNTDGEDLAINIAEGLLRYQYYISNETEHNLFTRVGAGDNNLDIIAAKNNIKNEELEQLRLLHLNEEANLSLNDTFSLKRKPAVLDGENEISIINMETKKIGKEFL